MEARREVSGGIAEIVIDGRRATRTYASADMPGFWAAEKVDEFREADINIFMTSMFQPFQFGWDGADTYDYSACEVHLAKLVRRRADVRVLLYVGARPGAPYMWCMLHSEQLQLPYRHTRASFDTGAGEARRYDEPVRTIGPSLGSRLWLRESSEAVRRFVEHFEASEFADNIIGYWPSTGCTEWHKDADDFSEPMSRAFREWLRDHYEGDVAELRRRWGDPEVTFETAELLTPGERTGLGEEALFHYRQHCGLKVADYFSCFNDLNADLAIAYARAAKEGCQGRKLVGMCHGYSYCSQFLGHPNGKGHGAARRLFRSPYIDFFGSPFHYFNRCFGGVHLSEHAIDSVLLRGKVFLDQLDIKTHLHASGELYYTNAVTPWQSKQVLKRSVAYTLSKNAHHYWYDIGLHVYGGQTTANQQQQLWFDDPELGRLIARLREISDENQLARPERVHQVALFTSRRGDWYRSMEKALGLLLVEGLRSWVLPWTGTPFDDYIFEDLPEVPPHHRVHLFPNAFYVRAQMRRHIRRRMEEEGGTYVWFYAPGYVDEEGCSLDNMEELTGIRLDRELVKDYLQVQLTELNHPFTQQLGGVAQFGSDLDPLYFRSTVDRFIPWPVKERAEHRFCPVFCANDADAEVLGVMRGIGRPGFVVKRVGKGRSVFIGAPMPPTAILRNILRDAGVHLYSAQGDLVYANRRYVTLCANGEGPKALHLSEECDVYDALEGDCLGEGVRQVSFPAQHGEVRMFKLERPSGGGQR